MSNFKEQSKIYIDEILSSIKNSEDEIKYLNARIKNDSDHIALKKKRIAIDRKAAYDFIKNNPNLKIKKSITNKLGPYFVNVKKDGK